MSNVISVLVIAPAFTKFLNWLYLVAVCEGKTLLFLADGNWSTSADGNATVMRVLLHESVWFDNSTAQSATAYDLQGDFCVIFNAFWIFSIDYRAVSSYTATE